MSKLKIAAEVMPLATAEIFEEIRENPLLNPFILIGGTALSLYIGHRVSEDLDFITLLPKLPKAVLKELERELERNGHQVEQNVDPTAYDDFQIAGMELADSQQDWIINGSVKLTFFSAETQHVKLLTQSQSEKPTIQEGCSGFKIATFKELCRLKATVTASRSKSRDWLDMFILERDHQFGMAQWKDAFDQAGLTAGQFELALKRMCEGKPDKGDESYSALLPNPPTVEEMQTRFRELRKTYETSLVKDRLKIKPDPRRKKTDDPSDPGNLG
jgi:hypothetical protein